MLGFQILMERYTGVSSKACKSVFPSLLFNICGTFARNKLSISFLPFTSLISFLPFTSAMRKF